MLFIVNGAEKEITLKEWDSDLNKYSPDLFSELETDVYNNPDFTMNEGETALICSEETYKYLVSYWENEVNAFNNGEYSEQFGEKEENSKKELNLIAD